MLSARKRSEHAWRETGVWSTGRHGRATKSTAEGRRLTEYCMSGIYRDVSNVSEYEKSMARETLVSPHRQEHSSIRSCIRLKIHCQGAGSGGVAMISLGE